MLCLALCLCKPKSASQALQSIMHWLKSSHMWFTYIHPRRPDPRTNTSTHPETLEINGRHWDHWVLDFETPPFVLLANALRMQLKWIKLVSSWSVLLVVIDSWNNLFYGFLSPTASGWRFSSLNDPLLELKVRQIAYNRDSLSMSMA